jgi:hypothetical protein
VKFWLGTHHATQRWFNIGVPLFVSRRVLEVRRNLPTPRVEWALDSGGFTELSTYGKWRISEDDYIDCVRRFQRDMPGLEWAAPMDWMCEPFMLKKTGLPLYIHQMRTVENFLRLRNVLGEVVIPVLQGWELDDYLRCWEYYDKFIDLSKERLVGVGSVCRRQDTEEAARIFRALSSLPLHGFGVKLAGLKLFEESLVSSDSMAWSLEARKIKRRHDRQESLFAWPKVMLCGQVYPDDHKAASCSNCIEWAVKWRDSVVHRTEVMT